MPINPRQFDGLDTMPPWAGLHNGGLEIVVESNAPDLTPRFDPATGALEIPTEDGGVVVDLSPVRARAESDDFGENLVDTLDAMECSRIAGDLIQGIESDETSRGDWLAMRVKGLELLGLKIDTPRSDTAGSTAPLEGMSTVRHPLLQEAVLRFQANSYPELCPSNGPAKVVNHSDRTLVNDELAQSLEDDLNRYLTTTATEYYPDTDRMLWWVGFGGHAFKKVYPCPLRRRPVAEMVDAKDLIVSNEITDLKNASRVTHRITMRKSVLKRMQILGVYANIDIGMPNPDPDVVDRKINEIQGFSSSSDRLEDADYELYECYCELNLVGHEHLDDNGEPTGLPLPYRVTIDKTSQKVLEIRRNWKEDDEDYEADIPFVSYSYISGPGFYGYGLLHLLGNTTNAITAAWREMLDAGMFANFPGFLYVKQGNRQMQNEFRIPPGGGAPIETGGQPITQMVMPLPYKEPGPAMMQLVENIASTGARVGGTAEMPVGEGVQNAPVGTTLALIEQATKIEGSVHKRLHRSQAYELQLLVDLFRQDPQALWRGNKRCALKRNTQLTLLALRDCDIVPKSDPNVPSRMHRLAKVATIKQLQASNPMLYDARAVDTLCLREIGINDPETLFAPPMPQMPDPIKMAELQIKAQDVAVKGQKAANDAMNDAAVLRSKENLQVMELAERLATHPDSASVVNSVLGTNYRRQ